MNFTISGVKLYALAENEDKTYEDCPI